MNTAVVILNFNGKHHLSTFLPSVIEHSPNVEIWVVDNNSSDDSFQFFGINFPSVRILALDRNYGFSEGYNQALKKIEAANYILLNSDVEVTKDWSLPLIERLNERGDVVACQPKVLSYLKKNTFEYAGASGGFLDKWGYPFCRGRIFDHCEEDLGQYDDKAEIFWATGACFAIKADVFHKLGGFDARFFAHMEEIDLCWRIHNAGYKVVCEPSSVVFHLGGGTLNKSNPHKTFLNYRNSLAMLFKNLPKKSVLPILGLRLILDGIVGLRLLLTGKWKDVLAIIKAHFSFYAMIPYLLHQSKNRPRSNNKLYPKSIIWAYFVKRIREFSELPHA